MDDFLRPEEIARLLKVSRPMPYSWIKKGWLSSIRIGKVILVKREDLMRFLDSHRVHTD